MQNSITFITLLFFAFLTLTLARSSTLTPMEEAKISAIQQTAMIEIALMSKNSSTSTNGTSACHCLEPGIWCGTRSGNATLNDLVNGRLNGTQNGVQNATRPDDLRQTLNGTCDWDTIYLCNDRSSAQNSLPCKKNEHAVKKHCWELKGSWYDICD